MSAEPIRLLTPEEYLAIERAAETKSEYLDGQMFAMAGASRDHVLITGNLGSLLRDQLRPRGCRTYTSDLRVAVGATGLYTYPDVVVVCGEERFEDAEVDTLLNPTLLVEVLSPSTESYDRGRKFDHYRALESLREYVLVSQSEAKVERYTRQEDGTWNYAVAEGLGSVLQLPGAGCELRLADVYDQTAVAEAEA